MTFWKSELIDFVICQQDAFDEVDCNCSLERQHYMVDEVMRICRTELVFKTFTEVSEFFKELINAFKQMSYVVFQSEDFYHNGAKVNALVALRTKRKTTRAAKALQKAILTQFLAEQAKD